MIIGIPNTQPMILYGQVYDRQTNTELAKNVRYCINIENRTPPWMPDAQSQNEPRLVRIEDLVHCFLFQEVSVSIFIDEEVTPRYSFNGDVLPYRQFNTLDPTIFINNINIIKAASEILEANVNKPIHIEVDADKDQSISIKGRFSVISTSVANPNDPIERHLVHDIDGKSYTRLDQYFMEHKLYGQRVEIHGAKQHSSSSTPVLAIRGWIRRSNENKPEFIREAVEISSLGYNTLFINSTSVGNTASAFGTIIGEAKLIGAFRTIINIRKIF